MSQRYEGADCLRAIAMFIIILYHIWALGGMGSYTGYMIPYGGEVGVTLFLVLSGFSMFIVIEKQQEKQMYSYRRFLWGRFLKIAPEYYTSLAAVILFTSAAVWLSLPGLKDIITHIFFIHNLFPTFHGSISGALWTIGLIFQFYLIAPLIHKAISRKVWLVISLCVIGTVLSKYITMNLVAEQWRAIYDRAIWTSLDSFVLGEASALCLVRKNGAINRKYRQILGLIGVIVTIIWIRIGQAYGIHTPTVVGCIWHSGLNICFCLLIICWGDVEFPHRFKKMINWFAKSEYSIYIWHLLIISNLLNNSPLISMLCNGEYSYIGVLLLIIIVVLWGGCTAKYFGGLIKSVSGTNGKSIHGNT